MRAGGHFLQADGNARAIGQRGRLLAMGAAEAFAKDGIGRTGGTIAAVATGFVKPVEFGPYGGHQLLGRTLNFIRIDRRQ